MTNSIEQAMFRVLSETVDIQRYHLKFSNGNTTPNRQGLDAVIGIAQQHMADDPNVRWADLYQHGEKDKIARLTADGHVVRPTPDEQQATRRMEVLNSAAASDLFSNGTPIIIEPKDFNKRQWHNKSRFRLKFKHSPSFPTLRDVIHHLHKQYDDVSGFAFYREHEAGDAISGSGVGRIMGN